MAFEIDPKTLATLDEIVELLGTDRSKFIRQAIRNELHALAEQAKAVTQVPAE